MIELVTDSASMLPDDVRQRFAISVVPIIVTVDGAEYAEGAGITNVDFYARMTAGAPVSTAAPSAGSFVEAYCDAHARGASGVLSIHTGAAYSATAASAMLASRMVEIPVVVVDTGVGSFPVALAVWAAAECLAVGGSVEEAAAVAERTASDTGSLFVVGVPEVARRGGRFVSIDGALTPTTLLELADGELHERGAAPDLDSAIEAMVERTLAVAVDGALRIGVGHAVHHHVARLILERLTDRLTDSETVIYEVGPSVGAHTGPGTLGVVYTPR